MTTTTFSPIVTWSRRGYSLWTKIKIDISDPNPSDGMVVVSWALQGGAHPNPHPTSYLEQSCSYISGYVTDSNNLAKYDGGFTVGQKWRIQLASGYIDPAHTDLGSFAIYACCRVASIDKSTTDYISVGLRNYIESESSNFLTPLNFVIDGYSQTQIVTPKVSKITKY